MLSVDLIGQTFGHLTVIARVGWRHHDMYWACRCSCGQLVDVAQQGLKSGHSTSCGCRRRQALLTANTTHGRTGTREYRSWKNAKTRCFNQRNAKYPDYGGRGITMLEPWRSDFATFYREMGPCPPGCTLDRRDNDGPYGPGNCRWARPRVQSNNTRRNARVTFGLETHTIAEWARLRGLPPIALWLRLNRYQWSLERALTTPVGK